MSVKVVIFGHSTLDSVIRTDESAYFRVAGGAGLYAASGAAYWCENHEVGICAKLGKQFREEELAVILRNKGIDASGLVRMDREGIKLWMLFDDDGYRHFVMQHDSCTRESAAPDPDAVPEAFYREAKGYHFAPMPIESIERILARLDPKRYVQLDPHYEFFYPKFREEWKHILPRVQVILPSEDELCKYFDIPYGQPLAALKTYAMRLADAGPKAVVIKLGKRGAMAYERDSGRCFSIPSCAVNVVDATGAGDTFGGSFLVSHMNGDPLELSMIKGTVGSSLTLEHRGVIENYRLPCGVAAERCKKLQAELMNAIRPI